MPPQTPQTAIVPVVRDVKFENELSTLKDKNTQILNERRRYTIQFYSKYS
jgi:hypothetical protein